MNKDEQFENLLNLCDCLLESHQPEDTIKCRVCGKKYRFGDGDYHSWKFCSWECMNLSKVLI